MSFYGDSPDEKRDTSRYGKVEGIIPYAPLRILRSESYAHTHHSQNQPSNTLVSKTEHALASFT